MPSPFPGMDPYLESPAVWSDFHARFITYCCDALADVLPAGYDARIEERVSLVVADPEVAKLIRPDIAIEQAAAPSGRVAKGQGSDAGGVAALEEVVIPLPVYEEVREKRIRIVALPGRELVAVLEVLSPWNKSGERHAEYLSKRTEVIRQPVHLIELDLLTRGERLPLLRPLPPGDYYALVSRGDQRPACTVYAWGVRRRLPSIPIPLRTPDPDVWLDLSAVFSTAYDRGRYDRILNHADPVPAKLDAEDAAWAAEIAKGAVGG